MKREIEKEFQKVDKEEIYEKKTCGDKEEIKARVSKSNREIESR